MELYVGRPNVPDVKGFTDRAEEILKNRRLTNNGPMVRELEARLSDYLDVKHVVCVCNATIGLSVAAKVLDLRGEVILPSFTFIASAHALAWQGITPVFCDIDPRTHNIDPARLEKLITPKTTGIMGVHIWGRACPHDELLSIARKHNLKLFYDAAHAFDATYQSRPIAALEDLSALSFHATKSFHTFEGGAIVTNDEELARKARLMINYSFEGADTVTGLGLNAKMSEIHAAMGLCNLNAYPTVLKRNREVYALYRNGLAGIPGIALIEYPEKEKNNHHCVVIEVDRDIYPLSRDELYQRLQANEIMARRYFYPGCHKSQPYASQYPDTSLPLTDRLCERVLVLPGGSGIDSPEQIESVLEIIERKAV